MFDWLRQFFTSEDAVVLGTGLGSIIGGIVIAYRAVKSGKPTTPSHVAAMAAVAASCRALDVMPNMHRLEAKVGELEEGKERAEEQSRDILHVTAEILKLVIRLEERTQRRG